MGLLAVGPIALGVPHLVADVRYLVARPALHRRGTFWFAVALPSAAAWFAPHAWVGMLALVGGALVARASAARKIAAVAIAALQINYNI